jgi:hypothetical protein
MKKLLTLILILAFGFKAHSQLEAFAMTTKDGLKYDLGYAGSISFKHSHGWSLAYAGAYEIESFKLFTGLQYSPFESLKMKALIGADNREEEWGVRYGGSLLYDEENKFLVECMVERGRHDTWFRTTVLGRLSEKFSLGFRQWTEHGIGLMGEYKFTKKGALVLIPMRNFTEKEYRLMCGLTFEF